MTAVLARHTLAPGGDLLTMSTLATPPVVTAANFGTDLRVERFLRAAAAVEQQVAHGTLKAEVFQESVDDQLANTFDGVHALRIVNVGDMKTVGVGLSFSRRIAPGVTGSVTYRYGHSHRTAERPVLLGPELAYEDASYHDFVTRLETEVPSTDTRVAAFYRLNALRPEDDKTAENTTITSSRFDVQVTQGLPFLASLTRADWELLFAFRNLFYEAAEGAVLDEVAVANPPKRVLGGISVRF